MATFKKGSAAAKAYMAKLRAARGKTKPVAVAKAKAKAKKTTKKIGSLKLIGSFQTVYTKAPADVKRIIDKIDDYADYRVLTSAQKALSKKGYFIDYDLNGSIINFKKIPTGKVGYKSDRTNILKTATRYIKNYKDKGYNRKESVRNANLDAAHLSGYKQTPEIILGRVGAVTLVKSLAPEVKLRINRGKKVSTVKITSAGEIADVLKKFLTPAKIQTQEYALAMFLNNNSNVLAVYQFGMGGFTATVMDKRLLMAAALKLGATAIILCHNHPSGSLKPSDADTMITKDIIKLAAIHDMRVLDHVILTKDSYYSFAENGLI